MVAAQERHHHQALLPAESTSSRCSYQPAPQLGAELAQQRLAPLDAVHGDTTRANLYATLSAWLASPGQRKTIAHSLGVHPQTVRYRMARLRELFGTALDDPDRRFELQLALRVRPYARLAPPVDSPDVTSGY